MEIARSTGELDNAAKLMERPPEAIKKRAKRLGLSFKSKASVKKQDAPDWRVSKSSSSSNPMRSVQLRFNKHMLPIQTCVVLCGK
jgi:hypothetical protein